MRKIVISDIHGCNATFKSLLSKLRLSRKDELYLLGDYIDRGPDSKGVIDTILNLQKKGNLVHCLRGNHEELLLWAVEGKGADVDIFLRNGGDATLESFGVQRAADIPQLYLDFIENLPIYIESGEYIFVHAGLEFTKGKDPFAHPEKMIWIRNWYKDLNIKWLGNRYIIHGHTPMATSSILKMFDRFENDRVLDIDAGCVYEATGYGQLCACDLGNRKLYFVPRKEADNRED
ncbi:metallophosphoesterase family protein [Haliscomenobacter sp.]|uniref:metallophosphoesterase family protein n=1 Tax=Haliscomenobacter sp. TaxID=2717303 RepID=UPI003364DB56